ncbi:MAG: hypothetical protein J2P45_19925 [Candidatus Dormibacteraeota bacterium]|nr:hypothetical protein [Candidatus Dormibacteraeota bacterium]
MEGRRGLYVSVDHELGRLLGVGARGAVQAKVYLRPDHYLSVLVAPTGEWRVAEVAAGGSPHIVARGELPGVSPR